MARRAVVDPLGMANRYPREIENRLVEALAARHEVTPEHVVLGNGSTEVLQMVVQASVSPRAPLVVADPTFEAVNNYRLPRPFHLRRIPLTDDHAHDLGRMREVAGAARLPGGWCTSAIPATPPAA